jgi:cell division septal protein FtsQ
VVEEGEGEVVGRRARDGEHRRRRLLLLRGLLLALLLVVVVVVGRRRRMVEGRTDLFSVSILRYT